MYFIVYVNFLTQLSEMCLLHFSYSKTWLILIWQTSTSERWRRFIYLAFVRFIARACSEGWWPFNCLTELVVSDILVVVPAPCALFISEAVQIGAFGYSAVSVINFYFKEILPGSYVISARLLGRKCLDFLSTLLISCPPNHITNMTKTFI